LARRATNNPRQLRSKTCGCSLCQIAYPEPTRKRIRDCSGSWQARYRDPAGKQKARNFPRKNQADDFLDDVHTRVRHRTYADPKRGEITLAGWWDMWWPAQPKKRKSTVNRKVSAWNAHLSTKWGAYRLCDLEYLELQAWLTNDVKGYATRKKVLELLRAMLRDAIRDGKRIPYNPCAEIAIEPPDKKHPDDLRPPTREQCALIREHCAMYYRPLLVFLEETGMRWGEVTGLRWCHVDLEVKHVKVKEVLNEDRGTLFRQAAPKTERGFRTVPLTPEAIAAVEVMVARWRPAATESAIDAGMHPEELVFRGPQGGLLTRHNFRRTWLPAIKGAGLARKVVNAETKRVEWWPHVHGLRHVFATRLKDLGIPEKDVQTVMGHDRGSKVTWLYQHSAEDVARAVRVLMAPESVGENVRTLRVVAGP
jgi:integrase